MRQNILGRVSTDLYVHLAPFQLLAHPLAVDGERGVVVQALGEASDLLHQSDRGIEVFADDHLT